MSKLVLNGDVSGSVTLDAPSAAGTTILTLPTQSGTVVVTSGAQTIEFADGSASTPSITNSGDTNTGMFFPAADTIAFAEGGVEAMRLDSAGNVGIGTSSPLNPIQTYKLGDFSSSTNNIRNLAYFQADTTVSNSSVIFDTNPSAGQNLRGFKFEYQGSTFSISRFHTDKTSGAVDDLSINSSGNLSFNSGYGSAATAYGCRAWVNFNGTGTVAIRGSANVSSISDKGTGDYTVNFTTAMPNANYGFLHTGGVLNVSYGLILIISQIAGSIRYNTMSNSNAAQDTSFSQIAIFR